MSEPIPAPTQTQHPWRATARTVFAAVVALATLLPWLLAGAHLDSTALGAQAIVVAGAVTRLLALPAVNGFLTEYVPWLAATPRQP